MYNFDEIIERRHTNAMNTDGFRSYIFHADEDKKFPYKDEEFVRMWVADMEFAVAPEIREAIKERVNQKIFGYSMVFDPAYYEAFAAWCSRKYDWSFAKEELVFSPGVIPALYQLLGDIVEQDEKMLIFTPSYGFFKHAATYNQVNLVCSDLIYQEGTFSIDFEDFAKKAADPKMKLVLLCNPHNPTGRVWTEEELEKIAEIIKANNLWVISDEIHCDILRSDYKHLPMGKIMPDYDKLVTCMSASKTFNMAGLMLSHILIRDEALREKFKLADKNVGFLNPLSIAAHKAAYTQGEAWLTALKAYLDENFAWVAAYLEAHLPKTGFKIPEATYLAWVDMRAYLGEIDNLPEFFANRAGVLLEGGNDLFVGNAEGYIRLNLAMPRRTLQTGLQRIYEAIISYKGGSL